MSEVIDYILDGLEAELALERELGVRFVECDREVLSVAAPRATVAVPRATAATPRDPAPPSAEPHAPARASLVFLHHAPLSPAAGELYAKLVGALQSAAVQSGKDVEFRLCTDTPVPKASVYVVMGALALKKFQPKVNGAPGLWVKTEKGAEMLVTYSPEYFRRFREVSPALQQIKKNMWTSLKGMLKKL